MRTTVKPDFPISGSGQLTDKLKQLASEFPITYIFFHPANEKVAAHIVITAEDSQNVETIESRKWIRNNKDENPISFHISSKSKMKTELRASNPFFGWFCQKSAIIY